MTASATIQVEARAHAVAYAFRFLEVLLPRIEKRTLVSGEIPERQAGAGRAATHPRIHLRVCRRCQGCRGQARPDGSPQQMMSFHMQTPLSLFDVGVSMTRSELAFPSGNCRAADGKN